jgi:hypothetical protein
LHFLPQRAAETKWVRLFPDVKSGSLHHFRLHCVSTRQADVTRKEEPDEMFEVFFGVKSEILGLKS